MGAFFRFQPKFEFATMKKFIFERMSKMPSKARVKLVEKFGNKYWEEMDDAEFKEKWDSICYLDDTVHSKRDIEEKAV